MKPMRKLTAALMALVMVTTGLMMPAQSILARDDKSKGGTTPAPPVTKTKLEVMEGSGEFKQWAKSTSIESGESVTFRWSTDEPAATSAIWMVSDKPFSSNGNIVAAQGPHLIASGVAGTAPAKGKAQLFDINFGLFIPKTLPKSPQSYWVFIRTKNARQQPVGVDSAPVKVTYRAPSQESLKFQDPDLGLTDISKPMPIHMDLEMFNLFKQDNDDRGNNNGGEPYLLIIAIYADGTTINVLNPNSKVTLEYPGQTHGNLGENVKENQSRSIPSYIGRYQRSILPIGLGVISNADAMKASQVALVVAAMEEDGTSTDVVKKGRKALVDELQKQLDGIVQSTIKNALKTGKVKPLDIKALQSSILDKLAPKVIDAMVAQTLREFNIAGVIDRDDFIGISIKRFSYADIFNAGAAGLPFEMDFNGSGAHYKVSGKAYRTW